MTVRDSAALIDTSVLHIESRRLTFGHIINAVIINKAVLQT